MHLARIYFNNHQYRCQSRVSLILHKKRNFSCFPSETFPYFATLMRGRMPGGVVASSIPRLSSPGSDLIFGSIKSWKLSALVSIITLPPPPASQVCSIFNVTQGRTNNNQPSSASQDRRNILQGQADQNYLLLKTNISKYFQ